MPTSFRLWSLVAPVAAALLLALNVGCGGGGGGGTGGGGGAISGVKVEAVLDGAQNVIVDPSAIQVGDRIKFVLSGRNDSGTRVIVPSKDWGLSPTSAGSLNAVTGLFIGSVIPSTACIVNGLTMLNESYGTTFFMIPTQSVGSGLQLRGRLDGTGTSIDLQNIQVGDRVRLVLTGRDGDNNVVEVPTGWSTTAPGSVGSLSGNLFVAAAASATTYQVTGTAVGRNHLAPIQIKPVQALVFGRVRTFTGVNVADVIVNFYTAAGTIVGTAKTSTDGTFRASVPTSAVTFHVDLEDADPSGTRFFRQYDYNGKDYAPSIPTCRAPLPALTIGVSTSLPADIRLYRSTSTSLPPPPPDGC